MDRKNEVQVHVTWLPWLWLAGTRCGSFHRKHGSQESVAGTGPTSILFVANYRRTIAQLTLGGLWRLLGIVLWRFVSISNRVE